MHPLPAEHHEQVRSRVIMQQEDAVRGTLFVLLCFLPCAEDSERLLGLRARGSIRVAVGRVM